MCIFRVNSGVEVGLGFKEAKKDKIKIYGQNFFVLTSDEKFETNN